MKALIVGAGAQGRVILDILRAQGRHDSWAFVDDDPKRWGEQVNGAIVACGLDEALDSAGGCEMIVALGNPELRMAIGNEILRHGVPLLNAIHPSAVIMPSARLGRGIVVGATAVVNTDAEIADHVVINTGAVVEHDCVLGPGVQVGPGAHLGGRVEVAEAAFISTGAIVLSRLAVGARTVVGAGAVVTHSLPKRVMAYGVPARVTERLDGGFDWRRVL